MRAGIFIALVLLAGCAFGADTALFTVRDAAQPFADGVRMRWIDSSEPGQRMEVVFDRQPNGAYTITELSDDEQPIRDVLFVPIADTPEEDYVAQLRLNTDADSVAFAYLWRNGEGYRAVYTPGSLFADDNLSAADPYCQWQSYQGCSIARREDVFAVYRALIYPNFVADPRDPENYLDLVPLDGAAPPPAKGRK
jgi:hypothetical protein